MSRLLGFPPFFVVSLCCLVYGFLDPPFTLPILLFILPTLSINLLLEDTDGLLVPAGLALSTGSFFLLSSTLAVFHVHGRVSTQVLIFSTTILCLHHCWSQRWRLATAFRQQWNSSSPKNALPNSLLLMAVFSYFVYSLKFWVVSNDNSLHAHYLQSAWYILEKGRYFFLKPSQDNALNFNFWYPNFNAHLNLFGACLLNWEQAIRFNAALGSFICWSGYSTLLFFLCQDAGFSSKFAVVVLVASLCSYSLFKIGPEISTDTPVLLFVPVWLHYLFRALSQRSEKFFFAAFATALLSFSFRFHAGFVLILASLLAVLPEGRKAVQRVLLGSSWKYIGAMVLILLGAVHWYGILYLKTGNPFHPRQPSSQWLCFQTRPEYLLEENWERSMRNVPPSAPGPEGKAMKSFLLYHFFALAPDAVHEKNWLKMTRGLFHGFTFSSGLTVLAGIGIFLASWRDQKMSAFPVVLLLFSLFIFIVLGGIHYKFFYMISPAMIYFSIVTLRMLEGKYPWLLTSLGGLFGGVFIISYLMTGFGSEPVRWSVLKSLAIWREVPQVKSYDLFKLCQKLKPILKPGDRILSFSIEPGFQLNYYLHNGYYFEDYCYGLSNTEGLHTAPSEEAAMEWLREHQIRWIVHSYQPILNSYLRTPRPEYLPKMIASQSRKLEWLADCVIAPR